MLVGDVAFPREEGRMGGMLATMLLFEVLGRTLLMAGATLDGAMHAGRGW